MNGMYLVHVLRNDMEICLWCDGLECQEDEGTSITVKKSSKKEGSSIQKGQQLDDVFEELRKKHSKSCSIPIAVFMHGLELLQMDYMKVWINHQIYQSLNPK